VQRGIERPGIDLAPTLLEVAGLTPGPAVQGRSLVPVLAGTASGWRTSFLVEYFSDTVFPRIRTWGSAAAPPPRHKYIQFRELEGMDELYDLDADPYEMTNLIARPEARDLLPQMQSELTRLLDATK
jgi:arylsulfatase A-like enzyme